VLSSAKSGIKSFQEFVAKAKANPGKLNYATPGHGGVGHLYGELIKLCLGIDMVHVPFTGAGPSLNAVIAGTTDLSIITVSGVAPQVAAGTIYALFQGGTEPWPELPNVPTVGQLGIPNAEVAVSQMLLAPAATPPEVVARLEREVLAILRRPDMRERMLQAGLAVTPLGGKQLGEKMAAELALWKDLVARAGIKPN
jgi:tripartite-type tricarboxylate transporter receptor subunit TctC